MSTIPGTGFLVGRSDFGELDISAYGMVRYMSQNDDDKFSGTTLAMSVPWIHATTFSRTGSWSFLKGWMGSEKLVYNITLWTVNTTDQDAMFANIGYQFSRKFSLYAGLTGNPGSRSLNGSHPFWLAHDRVMADEFFRPFFGSGMYATGEALPGLWYTATVSNNNSASASKRASSTASSPTVDDLVDADDARVRPARRVRRLGMARGPCDALRVVLLRESGAELPPIPAAARTTPRCGLRTASTCSRPARWHPA